MFSYIGLVLFGYLCPLLTLLRILSFNILGISEKRLFLGYDDFVDILEGTIAKLDYILGHFYVFRVFLKAKVQNGNNFWGCSNLNTFLGCLISLIFLGINRRCWVHAYVLRKIENTPPPWGKDTS